MRASTTVYVKKEKQYSSRNKETKMSSPDISYKEKKKYRKVLILLISFFFLLSTTS